MNTKNRSFLFDSQDPDEKIILVVRKHGLVLASPFIVATIILIFTSFLYGLLYHIGVLGNNIAQAVALTVVSLVFLYTLLFSFITWLVKYLDILILTNTHLVIIRQDGLFRRGTSVLDLSTIQDVATKQRGALQTFLGFGKIDVQTAGEAPNFAYCGVAGPNKIQDAIMDAKEMYVRHNNNVSSQAVENNRLSNLATKDKASNNNSAQNLSQDKTDVNNLK